MFFHGGSSYVFINHAVLVSNRGSIHLSSFHFRSLLPSSRLSADLKFIEVDKKFENPTGDETDTAIDEYQTFVNYLLQMADCRYACYDVRFTTGEGVRRRKLVFINFSPENAKIKHKMVYGRAMETLKSKLKVTGDAVQANDAAELALDKIISVCL